ncbi:MAG TPA: TonB family protein [Candidatus Acidoferrum sp.]|nr:TonB family protein [Candidatus Acidoferrum sp.]
MSRIMNTPAELGKNWGGRVVDEKFPLRQRLGGSDHSAVFLTERAGGAKTAIKLIPAQNWDADAQLARWASIAKLSHPHLIRLFESGRCQIEGTRLLYVVMECADENLAEVLPVRALTAAEASEMLPPAADALGFLHRAGFVHGRVAPSNITAVKNQLKLSSDSLRKAGDAPGTRTPSAYNAPEVVTSGASAAGDVWSLGMTLVAVLTQNEPKLKTGNGSAVAVPNTIPQPLREIARKCLQFDPESRCTVHDIVRRLRALTADRAEEVAEEQTPQRPQPWIWAVVALVVLVFLVWAGAKVFGHRTPGSTNEAQPAGQQTAGENSAAQAPAPSFPKSGPNGVARGSVLQQVMPDVSKNARNTITGHLKVAVRVVVDSSGNVTDAKFVTHGPSQYFASRALSAAEKWKFTPPQVDGRASASEWLLRFQFSKGSVQVVPTEVKP